EGFLHPQNIRRPPERAVINDYIIQKRISAKEQSNGIPVSHSVYRVDDTDITAITGLVYRENN
ncbi:hypothetical protein ACM260_004848, partial [Escherichia coli]